MTFEDATLAVLNSTSLDEWYFTDDGWDGPGREALLSQVWPAFARHRR